MAPLFGSTSCLSTRWYEMLARLLQGCCKAAAKGAGEYKGGSNGLCASKDRPVLIGKFRLCWLVSGIQMP
jgi:hypothetical protein